MRENLLLIMSLSGSAILLLYLLLTPVRKRRLSALWNSAVLKLSLLCFLVPFPLIKYLVLGWFSRIFPMRKPMPNNETVRVDILLNGHGEMLQASQYTRLIWCLVFLFGIIAFLFVLKQLISYFVTKRHIFSNAEELTSGPVFDAVQREKEALALRRRIRIYQTCKHQSPMTIGVFSPAILLPENSYPHEAGFADILRHELNHIKRHDLLIRFLGLLVVSIHWFNPFCHFFYDELCNSTELCCDAETMRGRSEADRKTYCILLIEAASECESQDRFLSACKLIGNDGNTIKERILALKYPISKPKKLLNCIIGSAIVLSGVLTSFAYQSPVVMEGADSASSLSGVFTVDPVTDIPDLPFECYFTDNEGTIYQATDDTQSSKAICSHSYVSGTYSEHIKSSNGSCTVKTYYADRCSICGRMIRGDLVSTLTYESCPH